MTTPKRAACSSCRRQITVRADGMIRHHLWDNGDPAPCPGVGLPPHRDRVKLTLACLRGDHGNCNRHTPGDTSCACPVCKPTTALEHVPAGDPTVIEEQRALLDGTIHAAEADIAGVPAPDPVGYHGETLEVPHDLKPPGVQTSITVDPRHNHAFTRHGTRDVCACGQVIDRTDRSRPRLIAADQASTSPWSAGGSDMLAPAPLTDEERRLVIAGHMQLDPAQALEAVATILYRRGAR